MDRKNIIIIILMGILASLCMAIGSVSIEKTEKEEVPEKKDENYKVFNEIDVSKCSHTTCDEEYTFNNSKIRIVVSDTKEYQILYNKRVILTSQEYPYLGKKMYTYDDKIIYFVYNNDDNFDIYIHDPNNKDFQMFDLDPNDSNWLINDVKFEENKITFETSRFRRGDEFVDVNTHSLINMNSCENYTPYADYDAAKTFEIKYENGSFSESVNTKTLKLKEYKNYSKLCK